MRRTIKETTGAFGGAITPRKTAVGAKNVAKVARTMAREKNLSRATAGERRRAIAIPDWTLYVPIETWNLIMYLRQEIRIEFGFDGVVSLVEGEKRAFRLEKLVIPKQMVTEGSVDYLESTVNLVSTEEQSKLIFHGHSHGDLDVFWSGIDERDIGNWLGDIYLNIVINNRGEVLGRIDFFVEIPGSGINEHVGVTNLRLVLEFSDDYKKEYAQTVSKITANRCASAVSEGAPASVCTGSVQTQANSSTLQKKVTLTGAQSASAPSSLGDLLNIGAFGYNDNCGDGYGYGDGDYYGDGDGYGYGDGDYYGDGDGYGYGDGVTTAADEFDCK